MNAVAGSLALLVGLALVAEARFDAGAALAGVACAAVGLAGGLAGLLVHRRRPAGRRLQIGLAVVGLPVLPFWTIASGWTLVTMFRRAERTLLSGRSDGEWTAEEAEAVRALPAPSKGRVVFLASGLLLLLGLEAVLLVGLPDFAAIERSKQKRTMADMRNAMTAIESYAVSEGAYPSTSSMDEVAKLLEPTHVKVLPRADAWGHPLRYEAWKTKEESPGPDTYVLASPGKDGAWQVDPRTVTPGPTRGTKADIVIRDGEFVRFPGGTAPSSGR